MYIYILASVDIFKELALLKRMFMSEKIGHGLIELTSTEIYQIYRTHLGNFQHL